MRYGKAIVGCVVCYLMASIAHAERKNIYGLSIDFIGSGSNRAGSSSFTTTQINKGIMPVYSIYPALTLDSKGLHSNLTLTYAATVEQFPSNHDLSSVSHTFNINFKENLGQRARLTLSESFYNVADFSVLSVITGLVLAPEGFRYVFEPSLERRSSLSNGASGGLEVDLTNRSSLTFSIASNYRRYEKDTAARGLFPDQLRTEGIFGYTHDVGPRSTVSVRYAVYQNNFSGNSDFQGNSDVRGHRATLAFSRTIRPSLDLSLEAGPSYIEKSALYSQNFSYYVSANLSKTLQANRFSFQYSHRAGDSSGFGYVGDIDQGGIGFARALGRSVSLKMDLSGFQQKQGLTSAFDYWGIQTALGLTCNLSRHWVVTIGGSYQSYTGLVSSNTRDYRRFYLSVGYHWPNRLGAAK